jgi:hypothetical protein
VLNGVTLANTDGSTFRDPAWLASYPVTALMAGETGSYADEMPNTADSHKGIYEFTNAHLYYSGGWASFDETGQALAFKGSVNSLTGLTDLGTYYSIKRDTMTDDTGDLAC